MPIAYQDPGQEGIEYQRQAFPREVVDDCQNAEPSAVGEGIKTGSPGSPSSARAAAATSWSFQQAWSTRHGSEKTLR